MQHVMYHVVRRDSLARIYFSFILLPETINWWRRGRNRSTQKKTSADELQKMPYTKPQDSSPTRDLKLHSSIGGRLGKQMCKPWYCAWPQFVTLRGWTERHNNNNNNNRIQRRYSRFFTISSQRRELLQHVRSSGPGNTLSAYHVQVSCYVPLGMKRQLSY